MAAELRALSYWADHVDPIPYLPRDLKLVDEVGREEESVPSERSSMWSETFSGKQNLFCNWGASDLISVVLPKKKVFASEYPDKDHVPIDYEIFDPFNNFLREVADLMPLPLSRLARLEEEIRKNWSRLKNYKKQLRRWERELERAHWNEARSRAKRALFEMYIEILKRQN
jgi:hypothetical protein